MTRPKLAPEKPICASNQRLYREIRRLLRLARRPHLLQRERLAIALCRGLKLRAPGDALVRVVEESFGQTPEAQRLADIVRRCDFRGEKVRAVAAAMHLSLRQFFRYRVEAIIAIARTIEDRLQAEHILDHSLVFARMISAIDPGAAFNIYASVLSKAQNTSDAIRDDLIRCALWSGQKVSLADLRYANISRPAVEAVEFAGRSLLLEPARFAVLLAKAKHAVLQSDGAVQRALMFEVTCLELLDAQRRADLVASERLGLEARMWAAENDQLIGLACAEQAWIACSRGATSEAAALVDNAEQICLTRPDLLISARVASAKSIVHLRRGNYVCAQALAAAAGVALASTQPAYAFRAHALAGRAALLLGKPWSTPEELCTRFPEAWLRADVESVRARHLISTDVRAAREAALRALQVARVKGARGSEVFARATLAAVLEAQGAGAASRALHESARKAAASIGDQILLHDLFAPPAAALRQTDRFTA